MRMSTPRLAFVVVSAMLAASLLLGCPSHPVTQDSLAPSKDATSDIPMPDTTPAQEVVLADTGAQPDAIADTWQPPVWSVTDTRRPAGSRSTVSWPVRVAGSILVLGADVVSKCCGSVD